MLFFVTYFSHTFKLSSPLYKVCFLHMIQAGGEHKDIVAYDELITLLSPLPPPPPPPRPVELEMIGNNDIEAPVQPIESPKPSRQKFKLSFPKKKSAKHQQDADSEPETPERPPRTPKAQRVERSTLSGSISAFQSFQDECNERLSAMFDDQVDVMVVSLGCVAIECPGLASEQEVSVGVI